MKKLLFKSLNLFIITIVCIGCDDFVTVDEPRTDLIKATVFENDATTNAAMTQIYAELSKSKGFSNGGSSSISFLGSYSSDEQVNYSSSPNLTQFYENEILATNQYVLSLWSEMYKTIYSANSILDGLEKSEGITPALAIQLQGEAKFIRAFCHFYLVNLYGRVPVVTTTDYRVNQNIGRSPVSDVYEQIVNDLIDAKDALPEDYSHASGERVRVNAYAASAFLARVYLYQEDWENAELEATHVLSNTTLYSLQGNLGDVFLNNNSEVLLQWWSEFVAQGRTTFLVFRDPPIFGALDPDFVDGFEDNDQRAITWISQAFGYYYASKYKTATEPPQEYSTVLRLAELFLIRAEARAQQNNISGAQSDLNVIRNRAGLPVTSASDKSSLLTAILQERKAEFFTEWGHRWFDLKRTNNADGQLSSIKPGWDSTDVLYPIPEAQLINDPAMSGDQNPGY